ncbi:hypothetical protein AAE02nite_42730 [Adhaeribacter aerolatus]|uniref:Uncharacterized protein n=1 Tax=Adhaeribacter aerolatus TaxID=670289 RepID=A0A512B3R6_9BACT|nr:hypothetical protein [Adhaeribacter aerolatus]GEO06609.1 hypothetical protein AAE02nite_42730 [Adhaeribacter aerolatus]
MVDLIKSFIDFFVNKENKTSAKYIWGFIIFVLLLIANDITGFTNYYSTHKGLEVAKEATELLKADSLSSKTRLELESVRDKAITRKSIIDKSTDWLKAVNWNQVKIKIVQNQDNPEKNQTIVRELPRSAIWHVVTSTVLFILFGILVAFVSLFSPDIGGLVKRVIVFFIVSVITAGLAWWLSFMFGLIPKIAGNWLWNYILNILLQLLFVYTAIKSSKNNKSTR